MGRFFDKDEGEDKIFDDNVLRGVGNALG